MATIFICKHCGDKMSSSALYCKNCKTLGQRDEIDRQNKAIREENKKKIPHLLNKQDDDNNQNSKA